MLRRGKTAEERFYMSARGWLAYPVTPIHSQLPPKSGCRKRLRRGKTAEVRFYMLARGWLAYPVTPMRTQLPPKSGCRNAIATYIVAERRLFSVTRYAERILPISRAGGTPLPMAGRLTQLAKIYSVIYTTALRR